LPQRINLKDWINFMLRSVDRRSRREIKIRVRNMVSKLRIGFCDLSEAMSPDLVADSWSKEGHPSWHIDNFGKMYRFGKCERKQTGGFIEGDVILIILDQDQCQLEFLNETQGFSCGIFCNVYGALVFGVQAEGFGDSVELLF